MVEPELPENFRLSFQKSRYLALSIAEKSFEIDRHLLYSCSC